MSFTIEGQPFIPDYRAKEKTLRNIISEREATIASLKETIDLMEGTISLLNEQANDFREEARTLRAKEYRRSIRRKKGRGQPDDKHLPTESG